MSDAVIMPGLRKYARWFWCLTCAICLVEWLSGASGWAGAAAFNAFAVVWALSGSATGPQAK